MPGFSSSDVWTAVTIPDLPAILLDLVSQIPAGRITTYGQLARALGDEGTHSARWIGEFLNRHSHSKDCPCHRVIRSNGEPGLHVSGDSRIKLELLQDEGVLPGSSGRFDTQNLFHEYQTDAPLARLRDIQKQLAAQVRQIPLPHPPRTVAGVDVAYLPDGTACGAYVLLDAESLQLRYSLTWRQREPFPYLPGYLTFRELPVMLELCRQAHERGELGDVLLCDGNGTLHPWRAGIAVCLGVILDHPVVGVGKSLLCGRVDSPAESATALRLVRDGEEPIGAALADVRGTRPLYVSVGNRITLPEAATLVHKWTTKHRLPEPISIADRLSKLSKQKT